MEFIQTLRLGNWLAIIVTSSNFFFPGKTCPFRAKYSLLVLVSQIIFMKGYHLMCFVFNHLPSRCPQHEMGQASAMTFTQFPKYPCDREVNVAKCLLKGHFYSLVEYSGTLWWWLILLNMEDIFIPLPPFFLFFCEQKIFVICLI